MTGKIAVIGVGRWGINHAKVCAHLRAEEIVDDLVIVDVIEERAKYVAKIYSVEYLTDISEVAKRDDIEYAILATPTHLHYDQAKMLLESGKHVLVEKPMTENAEQAKDLVEIAKKNNRILSSGMLLRFSPAVEFFMDYVAKKDVGRIIHMYSRRMSPQPIRKYYVGVVKDLAIHDIDLARYMLGASPIKVFAFGKKFSTQFEVFASIHLVFEKDGDRFSFVGETGWVAQYKFRRMEIIFEKVTIGLDLVEHKITIYSDDGIFEPKIKKKEPLYEQDKNFVLASIGKETLRITGIDAYKSILICDKIVESINKRKLIEIAEHEI